MHLEVDRITRCFGRTKALDAVSFSLEGPGIYGFVGPNGAGKTTLLRILAGLDDPDGGDARLDGVSLVEYPERVRRRIGFMPDTLPNAKDISVGEYLDFYASAFGLRGGKKAETLRHVYELTALDELAGKTLAALSKGMKQRVSLARLIVHDPELMLLDEPTAGLDPRARVELSGMLRTLAGQGKTIFISSHILSDLEEMITGLVILESGKLVSAGKFEPGAAAGTAPPYEEVILTAAVGVDPAKWLEPLRELPEVGNCRLAEGGGRRIVVEVKRGAFERVISAVLASGFPLGELRRTELVPELERIFLERTTGRVQ